MIHRKTKSWLLCLVILILAVAGCQRQPPPDAGLLGTQIAAQIYATLTAGVPSPTLPPPATPTARISQTPAGFLTPTPQPQVRVHAGGLNLREGPGRDHPTIETLGRNDILVVIGRKGDCEWLKVFSPSGAKGWVSGDPIYIVLDSPCNPIAFGSYRPLNGEMLVSDPSLSGLGALQVANQGELDLVLTMTNYAGGLLYAIYIRSQESATVATIPDGSYTLTVLEGREWIGDLGTFAHPGRAARLRDPYVFRTTNIATTTVSLSLGGSAQPNTLTDIPVEEFPLSSQP